MDNKNQLPLRIGVGIILLNQKNNAFVGKRIDNPKNYWQMPQGGVNQNESFLQAAKRELKEETGVKSVELLKELEGWFGYNLPENLIGKVLEGKYRGQKQKWFVMKFIGKDNEINVKTQKPEFLEWKWIEVSKLPSIAVDFKIDLYEKLTKQINLLNLI